MNFKADTTKEKILKVAEKEFLKMGFRNASLREIVRKAGVTTGSFYFHFKNKEHLFDILVKDTVKDFFTTYNSSVDEFNKLSHTEQLEKLTDINSSNDSLRTLVNYIYANYSPFKLLTLRSEGTKHEFFFDRLIDSEVDIIMSVVKNIKRINAKEKKMYKMTTHIITTAYFNGLLEIIRHDMSPEDADLYIKHFEEFYHTGWNSFFNKMKKSSEA